MLGQAFKATKDMPAIETRLHPGGVIENSPGSKTPGLVIKSKAPWKGARC